MKNKIKIPVAMQIRVDDVAWHNGADERHISRPSRSGLPRMHHPDDYLVLEKIGKALDTKICCSLVLGEWDKDNILRGEPHVTWDPEGWDRKSEIDMKYTRQCFENLEKSEHLDYTLHGIQHGYYHNGKCVTEMQYYPFEYDEVKKEYIQGKSSFMKKEEFRKHIELFFEIYNSWGFTKKIESMASPCGNHGTYAENREYAEVLKEFGIKCWQDTWCVEKINCGVVDGIICTKCQVLLPWDAYDVEPEKIEFINYEGRESFYADYTTHWTNYISINPENNMKNTDAWIDFYKRQTEVFGTMMSRDVVFAGSQAVYSFYSKMDFEDNKCIINLSDVDAQGAMELKNEFYVSFKNDVAPKNCIGGTIEEYETKKEFKTYKIVRDGSDKVEISL